MMLLSSIPRPAAPVYLFVPAALLLVAWLYAIATRPPIPLHAQVSDPAKFGWPSWYAQGGKTPYDINIGSGDGEVCDDRRSVLLFIDLPYDHPKIPHALDVLDTLEHDANVDLKVVASFQEGWRDDQRMRKNIEAQGCGDWVWRISDRVRDPEGACESSIWISEIVSKSFGKMDPLPADPRANITILPQPQHLVSPEKSYQALAATYGEAWEMGLFSHILPHVNPEVYYPWHGAADRKSITYFPRRETSTSDYPTLPWGRTWHVYRPDRLSPPPKHIGVDPLQPGSAYRRYWAREEGKKASEMRRSGVCVFEGWENGVFDERIVQAMLSGCVVATVLPEVQHDIVAPLIIPLTPPTTHTPLPSEELKGILAKTTNADLKRKALHAFILARQKFVPLAGIRSVMDAAKRWEEGGRGYLFPNGWRWTCSGPLSEQPPWCK